MERAIYDCYTVQGMTVEYIDMGVEYGYMGKTLQIIGEQDSGEISTSESDEVLGYYERDDAWSYAAHRRIFDAFTGAKRELTGPAG